MADHTATYSPDDDKIRIFPGYRLDKDTEYARVKAAGFGWAPKQECFYAVWSPDREDLAIEMAGEIEDDDRSLLDRAEERADRFEDYSESRKADAEAAQAAVERITDGIPLGQPILVGHHSERHARKDAERIENGMRRTIKMWETAKYWERRAAGAIHHAKYKELPAVRHRRIKGIEADKRRQLVSKADAAKYAAAFTRVDRDELWNLGEDGNLPTRQARAYYLAGRLPGGPYLATVRLDGPHASTLHYSAYDVLAPDDKRYQHCPAMAVDEVIAKLHAWAERVAAGCDRWIAHYNNRLAYERAMLAEAGGIVTDRTPYPIVPGGRVQVDGRTGEWLAVIRVNRSEGQIVSVTTQAPAARASWSSRAIFGIEAVKDYQPPTVEDATAVKAAKKLPPMANFPGEGFREFTVAEYAKYPGDYKSTRVIAAAGELGAYRQRHAFKGGGSFSVVPVFLTDAKVTQPPSAADAIERPTLRRVRAVVAPAASKPAPEADATSDTIDAMRASLKAGVTVVAANQLFPTPLAVALEMFAHAGLRPGLQVLEPSAGTGALIDAATQHACLGLDWMTVEINHQLAERLSNKLTEPGADTCTRVLQGDFLEVMPSQLGAFDRILMNPPFENGADIKHIRHALRFLKPGGRLVAVCADGPRQRAAFEGVAASYEALPAGSFKEQGTGVNTAIVVLDRKETKP